MGLGWLEGEDALGLLVFGDGEVVLGEAGDDGISFFIEDGDVEEDESGGGTEGGNWGSCLRGLSVGAEQGWKQKCEGDRSADGHADLAITILPNRSWINRLEREEEEEKLGACQSI